MIMNPIPMHSVSNLFLWLQTALLSIFLYFFLVLTWKSLSDVSVKQEFLGSKLPGKLASLYASVLSCQQHVSFCYSSSLVTLNIFILFNFDTRCEMLSLNSFNLHFPYYKWRYLFICFLAFYQFSVKYLCMFLLFFLNWVVGSFF